MTIVPQFEQAGSFSQGLARVRVEGKWGYIRR
ncbi:MAG: WG repeat-containing protein [Leptolyngbyaceae cyanobacterium CSU_1_3]|nr:WG repeat-containing protein [Leptolyngbyaceae cyanobacterium CSU_1_3]